MKEEVIEVSVGLQLSVSLESVLAGHEDKVFGLRWQKKPNRYKNNFYIRMTATKLNGFFYTSPSVCKFGLFFGIIVHSAWTPNMELP